MSAKSKVRATLYLDREPYERAKMLFAKLPGDFTVSQMVNQQLNMVADTLEPILDKALAGDHQAAMQLLQLFTSDAVEQMGVQMRDVRTTLEKET